MTKNKMKHNTINNTVPLHLEKSDIVNLGSFYTSVSYIEIVWKFIKSYIDKNTVVFDPAYGYGSFLKPETFARQIGNDIDKEALKVSKSNYRDVVYFNYNALVYYNRSLYGIKNNEKLIIIGNPPYNDITSKAKKKVKQLRFKVAPELKTRDIGISFLRMFSYLKADYVCILHPLSYLIKRSNFNLLKEFRKNYILKKNVIISSRSFNLTSSFSDFSIIIGLYELNKNGMDYEYIKNFIFYTIDKKTFKLKDFDYIGNYIDKYPKKSDSLNNSKILFYTLRDINALKRNRTFINKPIANAVKVKIEQLDYYVYVDIFKKFINVVPYYLRNLDVIIDNDLFSKYKKYFISYAIKRRNFLKKYYINSYIYDNDEEKIIEYFRKLLKEHFLDSKI